MRQLGRLIPVTLQMQIARVKLLSVRLPKWNIWAQIKYCHWHQQLHNLHVQTSVCTQWVFAGIMDTGLFLWLMHGKQI